MNRAKMLVKVHTIQFKRRK